MASQSSSIFQAWGSSTDQYGQRMRHQQIHYSMEGVDATLFTAKSYRIHSKYKPLCLRRVIFEIQRDFPSTQKDYSRTFSGDNSSSFKGLPNISDLRVTEIALQNATAYKQSSVLFRQPSQSSPPSLESILKEKLTKSRKKWRHLTGNRGSTIKCGDR